MNLGIPASREDAQSGRGLRASSADKMEKRYSAELEKGKRETLCVVPPRKIIRSERGWRRLRQKNARVMEKRTFIEPPRRTSAAKAIIFIIIITIIFLLPHRGQRRQLTKRESASVLCLSMEILRSIVSPEFPLIAEKRRRGPVKSMRCAVGLVIFVDLQSLATRQGNLLYVPGNGRK